MSEQTRNVLRTLAFPLGAVLLLGGCTDRAERDFLGSAAVQVVTYQVVSTVPGQVAAVYRDEGESVDSAELVAVVDTVPLLLRLGEVEAGFAELRQQVSARRAEVEAAKAEVRGLKREVDRMQALVEEGSAPKQQSDNLQTRHETAQFRLKAARHMLSGLSAKRRSLEAKKAQLREQIERCYVHSPCSGLVLTRYRNVGEMAGPAFPLYEIGRYDTVRIDFFVPQPYLSALRVGQQVRIRLDGPEQERFLPASIVWVADDAEFSPKNVQTREARNELVFRVRAKAANPDGLLKRGLPVEVWRQ